MYRYNFPHRKEKRRQEAQVRNEAYAKLSDEQKLDQQRLRDNTSGRGRQYRKLLARIATLKK